MVGSSKLDKHTQDLVRLIFDHDMFKEAMATMEIGEFIKHIGSAPKSQPNQPLNWLKRLKLPTTIG